MILFVSYVWLSLIWKLLSLLVGSLRRNDDACTRAECVSTGGTLRAISIACIFGSLLPIFCIHLCVCNIGCCFLLILNGFYYACSFGCHENFKIFVCLFCMITIFIYFSWFCGRGCEQLKSTSEHNDLTVRFMLMKWQKWNAI